MDRLKRLLNSIFGDYKTEVVLCVIGLAITLALIYFSYPESFAPSDTIQAITLIVLVVVTVSYAKSTHKIYKATSEQVHATQEAVRVAVDSERNSFAPIVELTLYNDNPQYIGHEDIPIFYKNVGKGPALNLVLWINGDDEQFCYLKSDYEKKRRFRAALGVGDSYKEIWHANINETPTQPLPSANSGYDVVAEYTDVFGRRFESKLTIIRQYEFNEYDQEFHYGRVKDEHD